MILFFQCLTNFIIFFSQFIKMKLEASGWPSHLQTEEERQQFVESNWAKGIMLDPLKIKKNAGRRYIAKLCLNR
jgi:hypothetical protein